MQYILYFLVVLIATTAGSLTGMGGGVIIKPLLDSFQHFDVETIGVLSSITVLCMSCVSIVKQIVSKAPFPFQIAIPLSVGSVVGGYSGQRILSLVVSVFAQRNMVAVIQNSILAVLILCVFVYMRNKENIHGHSLSGIPISLLIGGFLGICSSFLGIGGGPINVALIIYFYSVGTKTATFCSLMTILFAQISKLITVAFSTGFLAYDLSMAPTMVTAAILGGFLGSGISLRCSERRIDQAFNIVQISVLGITLLNIVRNL